MYGGNGRLHKISFGAYMYRGYSVSVVDVVLITFNHI